MEGLEQEHLTQTFRWYHAQFYQKKYYWVSRQTVAYCSRSFCEVLCLSFEPPVVITRLLSAGINFMLLWFMLHWQRTATDFQWSGGLALIFCTQVQSLAAKWLMQRNMT